MENQTERISLAKTGNRTNMVRLSFGLVTSLLSQAIQGFHGTRFLFQFIMHVVLTSYLKSYNNLKLRQTHLEGRGKN